MVQVGDVPKIGAYACGHATHGSKLVFLHTMSSCSKSARQGYQVWTDLVAPQVRSRIREARYCNMGQLPAGTLERRLYLSNLQDGTRPLDPKYFLVRHIASSSLLGTTLLFKLMHPLT